MQREGETLEALAEVQRLTDHLLVELAESGRINAVKRSVMRRAPGSDATLFEARLIAEP